MAIERARADAIPKPWGVVDLHPFSSASSEDAAIGEIWYQREGAAETDSALLLKLLFTSQPLSIQVHPDDAYAQLNGQRNGKTEAWYILRAAPDAKIALGLRRRLTSQELRKAIEDGSISDLVLWQGVSVGDSFLVPAGTIHAIGAGLVLAEIQQRSDSTYRIFDYGRQRELHVDHAVAVADAGPAGIKQKQLRFSPQRTQVVSSDYFLLERIELTPYSVWHLETDRETWVLAVSGDARFGSFAMSSGEAAFVLSDSVDIHVGRFGLKALVAYTGGAPSPHLLTRLADDDKLPQESSVLAVRMSAPEARAARSFPHGSDIIQ